MCQSSIDWSDVKFLSMNLYGSKMTNHYLDMTKEMFQILKFITLMPLVPRTVWSKFTLYVDHFLRGSNFLFLL